MAIGLALACGGDESRPVAPPWGGLDGSGLDGAADDQDGGSVGEDPAGGSGTASTPGTGPAGSSGTAADDDGTAGDGADDGSGPPSGDCPANCYCEPFDATADIADLEASFASDNWAEVMIGVLARRYPAGADLLVEMQDDPWFGAFTDTSSFTGLMDSVMTEVHEGTHGWDYDHAFGQPYFGYWLRSDLIFEPTKIDGFPRAEIAPMLVDDSTSLYAGTYLTGTQGTYGFYELLDEMNSYINGMGGIAAVGEHIPWGISGRDGAVAFMYYLELYLRRARTTYPELYAQMQAESEYVDLIRTQWLRLHFLLEQADGHPHLGIHDAEIRAHMHEPSNMAEIEMFVGQPIDASNCLP
ncbi:MAG: hypothetical protein AAF799_06525 [Myxococcota bacterium]